MQNLQKRLDAFIERFQDRWETEASFRATWSTIGSAAVLLFLCSCMFVVTTNVGSLFASNAKPTAVVITNDQSDAKQTVYPVTSHTPGADQSGNDKNASVINTIAASAPTITPTASPFSTGTPPVTVTTTVTGTVTGTPGGTGTPTGSATPGVSISMSQSGTIKYGQQAKFVNIGTTPPQANGTLDIKLDFGGTGACVIDLPPVPLTGGGSGPLNGVFWNPPSCLKGLGAVVDVVGTLTIEDPTVTTGPTTKHFTADGT